MSHKSLRNGLAWLWRRKALLVLVVLPLLGPVLLVGEHVRGRAMLDRYLRSLKAQGVKLTAAEFRDPPLSVKNGAPEVLAAAKLLKSGSILPDSNPPRMKLTPAGNAIVCFREAQWIDGKDTNHWEQLAADLETNQAPL